MNRSPSPNRLALVLCAMVFALAALFAQIAVLRGLPTLAASLPGRGIQQAWERAQETLARLSSAVQSTGLDAAWDQVRAQAPSVPLASSPEREVQAAWRRAQEIGAYRYATDIRQVTRPLPMLTNVGRSSREETLHLEGRINMPDQTMHLTLWNDDGNVLDRRTGLEMRVEGDKAEGRVIGGEWREMDDFTGLFAPGGDVAGYLAGAVNVRNVGTETRPLDFGSNLQSPTSNLQFTKYAFDMDGPSFAAYMRDQLEKHLIEKGELPAGLTLDKARVYNNMTGDGEIWIDENGLPLRLTLHLEYPEGRYEQQTVDLKTDFSNFARDMLARTDFRSFGNFGSLLGTLRGWPSAWPQAGIELAVLGLMLGVVIHRRSRKVYAAVVSVIIVSMVFTPLLQSNLVYAFTQKQAARQTEYEQRQEEQRSEREMQEEMTTSDWDPHANPLEKGTQRDSEELRGTQGNSGELWELRGTMSSPELALSSIEGFPQVPSSSPDPSLRSTTGFPQAFGAAATSENNNGGCEATSDDNDGDCLTNAQEDELGTDSDDDDTDGDQITDNAEVQGFWYNGRQWYSDPRSVDTNGDGVIDTHECPQRIRPNQDELSPTDEICQDTDGDGTPDLFDRDDDNDGVPDRTDMSPYAVMRADDGSPFDADTPLLLQVNNAEAGKPLFVNFQIRPDNPDRLWYTLNVLDWPSGDHAGQIQRRKGNDSTFKDVADEEGKEAQPRDENGDMRLVPMLEIEMYDTPLPLALTNPKTSVEVRNDISATIHLEQDGDDVSLEFAFDDAQTYDVYIYEGLCPASGDPQHDFTNVHDGDTRPMYDKMLVDVADGEHSLVVSHGDKEECADFDNLVNGAYRDKMVDDEWYEPYGISVREKNRDGTLVAYLPLNVVRDETGGAREAFAARMPYRPDEDNWGKTHEVRVVWLLQMLTDRCKPVPDDATEEEAKTWCDKEENWEELDEQKVVHAYYDDWYLTGLSVREDHGMDVGIVFEDPAQEESDDDRRYDHHLWDLAHGLEASFVLTRDEDDDGQRDITIDEIQRRWHNEINGGVSDEKRWNIPQNALQVHTFSYEHEDYIAHVMMTETVKILDDYFTLYKDQGSDAPTLLFAQEHHSRNANLHEDDVVTRDGNSLKVDLDPKKCEQEVVTLLSWAPYRYRNDEWESYPIAEFWDKLEVRFREIFPPEDEEHAEDRAKGRVKVAKAYYLQLFRGQGNVVQIGDGVEWDPDEDQTDDKLAEWVAEIIENSGSIGRKVKLIAEQIASKWLLITGPAGPGTFLQRAGRGARDWLLGHFGTWEDINKNAGKHVTEMGVGAIVTTAIVAVIVLAVIFAAQREGSEWIFDVINGLSLALAIRGAAVLFQTYVRTYIKGGTAALKALGAGSRITDKVGMVGFIISVAITWAAFVVVFILSGVGWGSLAFTAALASTIAATITSAILLMIAAIPIYGQIITAVISLIDSIIFAICGWADLGEKVEEYFCKGITGWVTEGVKWVIYNAHIMVKLEEDEKDNKEDEKEDKKRLELLDIDESIVDPRQGLTVDSQLVMSTTVKNTLNLTKIPSDWKAAAYWWQYNDKNLKSSTFKYRLTQFKEEDIHDDLKRQTMKDDWKGDERPFNVVKTTATDVKLTVAGINSSIEELYLAEGFAVPVQECWAIPTIGPPCFFYPCVPICYIRTFKATAHMELGKYLIHDIFPATLDEFYTLAEKDGGYALAWDQEGDLTFPRLKDADGDDLLGKADGGSDPDDSHWDTDFDGLSDLYEAQNGSDPRQRDVDGDDLSDYDEALLRTNPYRADTDSDGLLDSEEVFHQDDSGNWVGGWEFVYGFDADGNPLSIQVSSDPLTVDGDDDGLTDFQEKTFGFNPNVETDADILTLESQVHEVDAPWVLLHFDEDEGATTFSDSSGYDNHATCSGNACPEAGVSGKYSRAVEFGAGDSAVIDDAGTGDLQQLTVAAWVKLYSLPSRVMRFVTMGDRKAVLRYDGSNGPGQLHFYMNIGGSLRHIRVNNALTTGVFQHVAGTYDGGTMRLYLDGNQVGSLNVQGTVAGGSHVRISSAGEWLDGLVDDVAIYDRALSADEIQSLMAGQYNPSDHVVRPGDTTHYEATVKNELKNRYAEGLLSTDFPDAMDSDVHPQTFVLDPQEEEVMEGDVTVKDDAATGVYTLTQVAGALITDWREESDFAELQLHLDEEEGATTFEDSSGTQPRHDGECSGDNCPRAQVQGAHGYGLEFDGVDDYVTVDDDNIDDLQELTVAAWVKLNSLPSRIMRFLTMGNTKAVLRYYTTSGGHNTYLHFYMRIDGSLHHIRAKRNLKTDRFYHVVGTYDGSTMRLYQDGRQIGSLSVKGEVAGGSRVSLSSSGETLDGILDEVVIYPRALSADEVQALWGKPVLRLRFNESKGAKEFKDDSGFGHRVDCSERTCGGTYNEYCPTAGEPGISGKALKFRDDHLTVKRTANLDLSAGRFTLSAWIYPMDRDKDRDNHWQGVLGYSSGEKDAYPTLQIKNRQLRVGFGTGSEWVEHVTGDVLTRDAWNQVVATYTTFDHDGDGEDDRGEFTVYVNGLQVDSATVGEAYRPVSESEDGKNQFYIGRSSRKGTVYIRGVRVNEAGDGAGDAELCLENMGYGNIWSEENAKQDTWYGIHKQVSRDKCDILLKLYENDYTAPGDSMCTREDGGDDRLILKRFDPFQDPSKKELKDDFDNGGTEGYMRLGRWDDGHEDWAWHVDAIPFYGRLDEVAIYKRALPADEVRELFLAGTTALHLLLDDAPGATTFEDETGQNDGQCAGDTCPAAGVTGRMNQAAQFDGADDYLEVSHNRELNGDKSLTLAAWVKLEDANADQKVMGKGFLCTPTDDQVALYKDTWYRGSCVVKDIGEYRDSGSIGLPNNSISSIRVGRNVKVTLCKDSNFAGGCDAIGGNDPDLSDNAIGNDEAGSVKVQTQSPLCWPNDNQVALFKDADYAASLTGDCVVKDIGEYADSGAIGLPNDSISSIRVGRKVKATLCEHGNFGGDCETIAVDDPNLGNNDIGNDETGSVKVEANCWPNDNQVALFVHGRYRGQCVIKDIGNYASSGAIGLPNDSITSIRVGRNVKATLCEHSNFGGECDAFGGDDPDLSNNDIGNDETGSVKVEAQSPICWPNDNQVALFKDGNYTGDCVVKDIGEYANPGAIGLPNDSISSIRVGRNVRATLCQHDDFGGECETIASNDSKLSNNDIGNDRASSVRVGPAGGGYVLGVRNGHLFPEVWDEAGNWHGGEWGTVPSDEWTHLALTWRSGDGMIGYVNGQEVRRIPAENPIRSNSRPLRIGAAFWDVTAYNVDGIVDEVAIYRHALGADEIRELYKSAPLFMMHFDENEGATEFRDDSGKDKYGTCGGTSCPTAGVKGQIGLAAEFDGEDDYVSLGERLPERFDEFTWMGWVKGSQGTLIRRDRETTPGHFQLDFNDRFEFTDADGHDHHVLFNTIPEDHWAHVAATYDGSELKVYVNGSLSAYTPSPYPGDPLLKDSKMWLHLDETGTPTEFEDASGNDNHGTCTGSSCPTTVGTGMYQGAAEFTGSDNVTVAGANTNDLQDLTVATWVKLSSLPADGVMRFVTLNDGKAVLRYDTKWANKQLVFYMKIDGSIHTIGVDDVFQTDTWYHVAGTYDGNDMRLYLDGEEVASLHQPGTVGGGTGLHLSHSGADEALDGFLDEVALFDQALTPQEIEALAGMDRSASSPASGSIPSSNRNTEIGRGGLGSNFTLFNGRIDEVSMYDRALSAREVRNVFLYQAKWAEDRESHEITVDDDKPDSTLESDADYLPNHDVMMHVSTTDPTSWAAVAELGVSTDDGQSYTWLPAPACRDADVGTAWCPTFDPRDFVGEGRYTLKTRTVDVVGNAQSSSGTDTILVDGTAPQVSTTMQDGRIFRPDRHPTIETAWTAQLDGTVNDPDLSSGDPGSGVASDGVHVTLFDSDGERAGQGRQAATLGSANWAVDYDFYEADVTGAYTVSVEARDKVNNSSTTDLLTVRLDTTAPSASLDSAGPVTDTITTTLTLRGTVTDTGSVAAGVARLEISFQPVEQAYVVEDALLLMHLDEEEGATHFADDSAHGHPGTCSGDNCPTAGVNGKLDEALRFDGDQYLSIAHSPLNELRNNLTVAAWIKPAQLSGTNRVAATARENSTNGFGFGLKEADLLFTTFGVKDYRLADPGLQTDEWQHVAAVMDGNNDVTFYVNGVSKGTVTHTRPGNADPDDALLIGATTTVGGSSLVGPFRGLIDEVALFDRALSPEEVQTLYEAGGLTWEDTTLAESGDGVVQTTWSHPVPEGLEGIYQINLRGTDTLGNRANRQTWNVWRGQIDTRAARADLTVNVQGATISAETGQAVAAAETYYECWGQDFNLYERISDEDDVPAEYDFQCPCEDLAPADTTYERAFYDQVSPWYRTVISDTTRPYELRQSCTVVGVPAYPVAMKACDVHGHCTEKQVDAPAGAQADVALLTETRGQGDEEIAQGNAEIPQGDEEIADASVTLSPPHPLTLSPDLEIDISPIVLTTTHRVSYERVRLTGRVTDTAKVDKVIVKVEDEGWQRASIEGDGWRMPWYLDEEPDGKQYTVTARASTVSGETARVTETVTVDLQPPAEVTVTLTTDGTVLEPGDTVREVAPTLTITWTASSDNSGLADYLAGWNVGQVDNLSNYDPAGPRRHDYVASEPQMLTAVVVSQDQLGNQTRQEEGPIYVDAPTTPDYIPFPESTGVDVYHDWMDSGCSHVGTDRRVSQHAQGSASLDAEQKFYATWDSEALRLVWTGARWNTDGDLFIYLDFQPGGTNTAYNPYGDDNTVYLPGHDTDSPMEADYLIWVQDAETADLLRWDGGGWVTERTLSTDEYRFDAGLNDGHTDLYILFDLMGVTDPAATALDLVAFASEQDGLRLWATMPDDNPVSSERVVNTDSHAGSNHEFALQHQYHWDDLGDGVCPNGSSDQLSVISNQTQHATRNTQLPIQYPDTDLEISISADPVGTAYSFIGDDLFWLWESLFDPDRPADLSESFTFMDVDHPPLGDGQEVLYTVHYRNQGTSTAAGVWLDISARYALRLPDGDHLPAQQRDHQIVQLGDVGPGDEGVATFRGVVDLVATRQEYYEPCLALFPATPEVCDPYLNWAAVTALVYDNAHPDSGLPLDWMWVDHKVDSAAPEFFGIVWPEYLVSTGVNTVRGYAYDASGVPQITLEIQSPSGGTTTLNCPDTTPQDGQWSCDWDVTATNGGVAPSDGNEFQVRLQATDGFGQVSEWTAWQTFVVDTEPPTLTLDEVASGAADGSLVDTGAYHLVGDLSDNHGLGDAEICIDGDCAPADVQLQGVPANVYDDEPAAPLAINASTTCGLNSIVRTFEVTESFTIGGVSFGFNATHTRRDDIVAVLESPAGTQVQVLFPRTGTSSQFQNYDVLLNDAVPSGLHDRKADDDPAAPYYDRSARPHEPLQAFQGEDAAGPWTLTICDTNPLLDDGTYNRSRLVLKPQNTAAQTGRWVYTAPGLEALDAVEQTVIVTGIDLVGNRTQVPPTQRISSEALGSDPGESLVLSITVDNVAPAVTAQQVVTSLSPLETPPVVLNGTASDGSTGLITGGGGVAYIHVLVQTPGGQFYTEQTARDGEAWEWTPSQLAESGTYYLWGEAEDRAGNVAAVGPFALEVAGCGAADLTTTFVTAEIAEGSTWDILLTAQVRNDGGETVPAGLPVSFYQGDPEADGTLIGTAVTADTLAPGESEEVSVIWTPEEPMAGDYEIHVVTNDAGGYEGGGFYALCAQPERVEQAVSILDVPLVESWNLMSTYVNPFNTDASVVQLPIAGKYVVIQGFDSGAQSYYPDLPPEVNTLKDMDAEHGYWVKVKPEGDEPSVSSHLLSLNQDEDDEELTITLRVVGEGLTEDQAIELNADWNLVSYLPREPLAVPDALQSIDGLYTVVLGYDQGALSYYPDIDPSFNTLHTMETLFGYWIRMAQAGTLQYPITEQGSGGTGEQGGRGAEEQGSEGAIPHIREAERAASVMPTNTWMNFYGPASLPVGTVVQAIDPAGVVCGATVVTTEGQYGLLACYGDDPTTPEDEGALPGDTIQLVVDGRVLGVGTCTEHGSRQWRPLGKVDLWQLYLPLIRKGGR